LDKKPNLINILLLTPYFIVKKFKGLRLLLRFIKSNRNPIFSNLDSRDIPSIEILIVCESKDIQTLPFCIKQAVKHSVNRVKKISIVVPNREILLFGSLTIDLETYIPIEIMQEDDLISLESRNLIKSKMGKRYGWALQQFLTVAFTLKSSFRGVLAIDADTILILNQQWLDSKDHQVLLESYEYNFDYYDLLKKVSRHFDTIEKTFITHHMLFQPKYLLETLNLIGATNIEEFIEIIISNINSKSQSPVCAEFEPYAQFMYKYRRAQVEILKFCNISYRRDEILDLDEFIRLAEKDGQYKSISLHTYAMKKVL
jgi:hypothetical protein